MKCITIQRWMLLDAQPNSRTTEQPNYEGTGSWRKRRIRNHLDDCPSCRAWREGYRRISQMATEALSTGEPSEKTLINIRREARVRVAEPHTRATWGVPAFVARLFGCSSIRPLYALTTVAAVGLVLVGAWWIKPSPNGAESVAQLRTIMLMLSKETASLDGGTTTLSDDLEEVASLDTLAQQLLTLQGLDAEYTETELSTPVEALPATDPLTRSTSAFRAERYG